MRKLTEDPYRLTQGALAVTVLAGLAEWVFVSPDDPFEAFLNAVIASGSATVVHLPFLLS